MGVPFREPGRGGDRLRLLKGATPIANVAAAVPQTPNPSAADAMEAFFNELFRCVATLDGQGRATLEARIRTAREPMVGRDAIDRVTVFVSAFLGMPRCDPGKKRSARMWRPRRVRVVDGRVALWRGFARPRPTQYAAGMTLLLSSFGD